MYSYPPVLVLQILGNTRLTYLPKYLPKTVCLHQMVDEIWWDEKPPSSVGKGAKKQGPLRESKLSLGTLPETNSSPLKNGGWETTFLLGRPIFRGELLVLGRVMFQGYSGKCEPPQLQPFARHVGRIRPALKAHLLITIYKAPVRNFPRYSRHANIFCLNPTDGCPITTSNHLQSPDTFVSKEPHHSLEME